MQSEPRVKQNPCPKGPVIRIEDLSRRFVVGGIAVEALAGVSMTIQPGEFVTIVGRSGSGKSTLLHLIAALDAPSSGRIEVGSWDLGNLSREARSRFRRTMVGLVFQQYNLIPSMSAIQNVMLPLILGGVETGERKHRAANALALVGLEHRAHHRPTELSGGEQQRVALGRALVFDAPIILADEPTGNLDSKTAKRILELLASIHRVEGKTIVLVTHNESDAAHVSDRIFQLMDGRIASQRGAGSKTHLL
jgi:ABC-type lipoprotein export system ATPase subunit